MHVLTDPILQDVVRIVERHPDLNPEFKIRLLDGLDVIDAILAGPRDVAVRSDAAASKAKR
jgi:hypothetical protein